MPSSVRGKTFKAAVFSDPPYFVQNASGQITSGIGIDLIDQFETKLGVKFQLVNTSFAAVVPGLQSGRYDMFIGMGDYTSRQKEATFVDINKVSSGVMVPASSKLKITQLTDLCGHSLGTIAGSSAGAIAQKAAQACAGLGKPAMKLTVLPDQSSLELAMLSGRLDAYTDSSPTTAYTASISNGKFVSTVLPPSPVNGPDNILAIGMTKDSPLVNAVLATMQELVNDGTYNTIYTKYGLSDLELPLAGIKINGSTSPGN